MLDREIGLSGVQPDPAAPAPPVSKARIEFQRAVDQRDRAFDVLAKVREDMSSMGEYARVVTSDSKAPPSEIDRVAPVCFPVVCPTAHVELDAALCC